MHKREYSGSQRLFSSTPTLVASSIRFRIDLSGRISLQRSMISFSGAKSSSKLCRDFTVMKTLLVAILAACYPELGSVQSEGIPQLCLKGKDVSFGGMRRGLCRCL